MNQELVIRLVAFLGFFMLIALGEILAPRRVLTISKSSRWTINLAILLLNPLLVNLIFPLLPVGVAYLASKQSWGLLNNLQIPYWLAVLIAVLVLDLIIYLQHVLFHAVPAFWRLHMIHHADLNFDLTTGLRFHPLEIIISMLIKLSAVVALGAPVLGVLIFEIILNATSMFNHSNMHIPGALDRIVRLFVVTPDMHRVHHSVIIKETNSNFGFNLPWWDRLLGTYKAQPEKGHLDMVIGLAQFRDFKKLKFLQLLMLPFWGRTGRQPINRH
jgi:sterol desaturase/sphingolipid hydroxylase (fatty acid hydroxylase superfamily)